MALIFIHPFPPSPTTPRECRAVWPEHNDEPEEEEENNYKPYGDCHDQENADEIRSIWQVCH